MTAPDLGRPSPLGDASCRNSELRSARRCNAIVRLALVIVAISVTALAAGTRASAKEGARAQLTTALPLDAAPATTIRVEWTVDVSDASGGRRPFNAIGMFVRLLSRTGAPSTTGFASATAHEDGRYAADVSVPAGRIGGLRMGLRGSTDIFFPLENDPFTSPGGVRCDVAALRTTLTAFVRAYNRGDLDRLDQLFSREHFVWYSSGGPARSDRDALIPNLRRRYHRGDRLRSVTFRFNGYERERNVGHFELRAERRADDLRDGSWFPTVGKGALDCSKPPVTIAVMFLGGPGR